MVSELKREPFIIGFAGEPRQEKRPARIRVNIEA